MQQFVCGVYMPAQSTQYIRFSFALHRFQKSFCVQDLIISGAQIGACNKRGQTPMDVCQGPCRQAIAGSLVSMNLSNFANCVKVVARSSAFYSTNIADFQRSPWKTARTQVSGYRSKIRHGRAQSLVPEMRLCRGTLESTSLRSISSPR